MQTMKCCYILHAKLHDSRHDNTA